VVPGPRLDADATPSRSSEPRGAIDGSPAACTRRGAVAHHRHPEAARPNRDAGDASCLETHAVIVSVVPKGRRADPASRDPGAGHVRLL